MRSLKGLPPGDAPRQHLSDLAGDERLPSNPAQQGDLEVAQGPTAAGPHNLGTPLSSSSLSKVPWSHKESLAEDGAKVDQVTQDILRSRPRDRNEDKEHASGEKGGALKGSHGTAGDQEINMGSSPSLGESKGAVNQESRLLSAADTLRSTEHKQTPIKAGRDRGAPPPGRPAKTLTPISARRARLDQRRRDEETIRMLRASSGESSQGDQEPFPGGAVGSQHGVTSSPHRGDVTPDSMEDDRGYGLATPEERPSSPDSHEEEGTIRSRFGRTGKRQERRASSRFSGMRNRMREKGKGPMQPPSFRLPKAGLGTKAGRLRDRLRRANGDEERESMCPDSAAEEDVDSNRGTDGGDISRGRNRRRGLGRRSEKESKCASNDSLGSPEVSQAESGDLQEDESSATEREEASSQDKGSCAADYGYGVGGDVTLGHVLDRKMREMGYIRKPPVDELKNRQLLRDRVAAENVPEVHFIGEILGAEGFGSGVSCRFCVESGKHWTLIAGLEEGQTHAVYVDNGESFAVWNHPLDLHYGTKSMQGWPRLTVQVWQLDMHGRNILRGYGFRHLPSAPGHSEVSVPCWRPTGTLQEEVAAFFLGTTPRLTAEDAIFNRAWDQRCRLVTLPAGTIWMEIDGLFRNFHEQGVDDFFAIG